MTDFYEVVPSKPTPNEVRYHFRACWRPLLAQIKLADPMLCIKGDGFDEKTASVRRAQISKMTLVAGFYQSSKKQPQATKKFDPDTRFAFEIETPNKMEVCKEYTTPALARTSVPRNAAWIRLWHEDYKVWGNQNEDYDNDVMMARAELRVKPLSFRAKQMAEHHEIEQEFEVCNSGGVAKDVTLGLSVGNAKNARKPGPWKSFVDVGTLKPHKCKTVSHTFNTYVGLFRGFVMVDPKAKIPEGSEANNIASFDYGAVEVHGSTPRKSSPDSSREQDKQQPPPEAPSEGEGGGGTSHDGDSGSGEVPPEAPSEGQGQVEGEGSSRGR